MSDTFARSTVADINTGDCTCTGVNVESTIPY